MTTDARASHPGTVDVRPYVARPGVPVPPSPVRAAGRRRPLAVSTVQSTLTAPATLATGLLRLGLTRPSSA